MTLPKGWTSRLTSDKPYASGAYTVAIYDTTKRHVGHYRFTGYGHRNPYTANGASYPNAEAAIIAVLEADQ